MFLITWIFDKLGYMPKITVDTSLQAWPFPEPKKKPVARKPAAKKKPAVAAKTARTKKAK
jgi:hypothetical protein